MFSYVLIIYLELTVEAGNAGGKCPFALQCMLHGEWDISEDCPSSLVQGSVYMD